MKQEHPMTPGVIDARQQNEPNHPKRRANDMIEQLMDDDKQYTAADMASQAAQGFRDGYTAALAPAAQGEPVGWQFYQDGKWWRGDDRIKDHRKNTEEAGFRVRDVYAAPQPAEQQPVSWIRIRGDHVILSRCDWMYPASTEDSAGLRDEQRFTAVGRRDGDIVLPAPEGALDREDLKTMLTWPSASKPAEQKPAPDVAGLVAALRSILGWRELRSGPEFPVERVEDIARSALQAHQQREEGQ